MNNVLAVVLFGAVGVVFLVVVPIGLRNVRKQGADVQAFATKLGWRYTQRNDNWARISARYPFDQGGWGRATNIIEGTYDQRTMAAFELMCTSSGGGTQAGTSEEFSICVAALPVSLPYLEVSHMNALGRMAQSLGERPIQIESEEFNRSYTVRSSDPKFASDVLSPTVVQALLAQPPLHWFIEGGLLVSSRKQDLRLDTLTAWFSTLSLIASSIPDFAQHDHGTAAATLGDADHPTFSGQQPVVAGTPQPSYPARTADVAASPQPEYVQQLAAAPPGYPSLQPAGSPQATQGVPLSEDVLPHL